MADGQAAKAKSQAADIAAQKLSAWSAENSYVRAVVFWTPECRFCRQVVEEVIPGIIQPYGGKIQILYIDLNQANGEALYQAALEHFGVGQAGIPMLVVDQVALQGSQIARDFPGLVEKHLAAGGVDWPDIPGLESWLENLPPVLAEPLGTAECEDCAISATKHADMMTVSAMQRAQVTAALGPGLPVVRAVMFWMNGCPHCHEVIEKVLPPLQQKYGAQLQIHLIELVGGEEVTALYELAKSIGMSPNDVGVPFLIIGDQVLVGAAEIPARLPGLIEEYLNAGGVDYPNFEALAPLLPTNQAAEEICLPEVDCEETTTGTPGSQVAHETTPAPPTTSQQSSLPSGFSLALAVLVGMGVAVVTSGLAFILKPAFLKGRSWTWLDWANLILAVIGIGVAGYLAYVETQLVTAICGPVGDCNTVQQSSYARLYGVLPIGVLGVLGYLAILAAWLVGKLRTDRLGALSTLALYAMSAGGTLFSIYLTYLELYVIRAVCMWCVSSAVVMTLLMLVNTKPAVKAMEVISNSRKTMV